MNVRINWTGALAALAVFSFGSVASAQDWESGDTGAWGQPPPDQQQQQPAQQQPPAQQQQQWQQQQPPAQQQQTWQGQQQQQEEPPAWGQAGAEAPPAEDDGETDHSKVVGHLGVGWFGVSSIPVGVDAGGGGGAESRSIPAPTIGVRFWLADSLGLDVGLGFGFVSASAEAGTPAGSSTIGDESGFAFALHAGLPLNLYSGEHYSFQIIPEANLGIGSYTILGDIADNDQDLSGLTFSLGGRVGAEIQFGFIDIPELSLVASVGLALEVVSTSWETQFGDVFVDASALQVSTTVQEDPWDIFVGGLSAIYYLR